MLLEKIIVADDESIQRIGLIKIVEKFCPEAEIYGCKDGVEAYERLMEENVQILLTDIKMPIMDGIELIQKVSINYPKTQIILISAYRDFEYAKTAMQCSVLDYLIKPFRISDVEGVILKAKKRLEDERNKENIVTDYNRLVDKVRIQEEIDSLRKLVLGKEVDVNQDCLRMLDRVGTLAVIQWRMKITEELINSLLSQLILTFPDCVYFPLENEKNHMKKIILFLYGFYSSIVVQKLELIIRHFLDEKIIFWVGVSNPKNSLLKAAREGYLEAEEVLSFSFYARDGGIFLYGNMRNELSRHMIPLHNFEKELRKAIQNGDIKKGEKCLTQIYKQLIDGSLRSPKKVKHGISSLIVGLLKELEGIISEDKYDKLLNDAYLWFNECYQIESLFEICNKLILIAVTYYQERCIQYDPVDECISYIKRNLHEELSLQIVADKVHFHPNYLSLQIKERTGLAYSNYVLMKRMELACKLLIETDNKVNQIAVKCGFRDNSYFTRVFRKQYEMSPEKYRKVHKTW